MVHGKFKVGLLKLASNPIRLRSRIHRLAATNLITVLNLHKVSTRDNDFSTWPPLDTKLFEALIIYLKHHYHITTFSKLLDASIDKPKIILSFDDGYKNFIEYAVPILEKHKVTVNQNVLPGCSYDGLPPLNVMAEDYIGSAPRELLDGLVIPNLSVASASMPRKNLGRIVSNHIKNLKMEEQKDLKPFLLDHFIRFAEYAPTPMMSIEEIAQISNVHEIGLHSWDHANMSIESEDYFRKDLARCAKFSKNILNCTPGIYAFPNGSYNDDQLMIASEAGYKQILLVNDSFSNSRNLFFNRFNFDASSMSELKFRVGGNFSRITSKESV